MASVTLKGVVAGVGEIQLVGEKLTKLQLIVLHVAGYVDGFGEKKGRDQQWLLQAIGEKVDKLKLTTELVGKKMEVKFFSESYCIESKEEGKDPFYVTNHTIHSYEIFN